MRSALSLGFLALSASVVYAAPKPLPVHLQARKTPKGHISAIRRRALDAVTVPLDDFFLGTDLQWFGNISVGTPPQPVSVVFDTGSQTLEFADTECTSCNQTGKFDPSKSSTFVRGNTETTLQFSTGVGVDPVVNDDYVLTVRSATDSVTVGTITLNNVSLFTIVNQTSAFNIDPFIGIQGMGSQAEGFFEALIDQGLPSLFSMFLTPDAVGNAELLLGGIDDSKFKGDLVYANQTGRGDWVISSSSITVNGQTTSLLDQRRNIIFDSGTSNILFPTQTAEAMYALISEDIQPFAAEPGAYGLPCDQIDNLPAIIDITFISQTGEPFNLTIPSTELNVGPFKSNTSTCQTLINAFDGLNLVGGSVLKHYYSVWDVGNQRLGFAPNGNASIVIPTRLLLMVLVGLSFIGF